MRNSARSTRAVRPLNARTTRLRIGRADSDEQVHVIGHDFLGHDVPSVFGGDLLQQLPPANTPARNAAPIFRHHTRCNPSAHTPPGVQRNRRPATLGTLQNRTDTTHNHTLVTSPDTPTAKAAGPLAAH